MIFAIFLLLFAPLPPSGFFQGSFLNAILLDIKINCEVWGWHLMKMAPHATKHPRRDTTTRYT
ncbi:hypothetical protein CEP82_006315 [Mobiluncus mulieris]|nr:hypothetical protein CEP82_006315 [Mobiluncus mulieris]